MHFQANNGLHVLPDGCPVAAVQRLGQGFALVFVGEEGGPLWAVVDGLGCNDFHGNPKIEDVD